MCRILHKVGGEKNLVHQNHQLTVEPAAPTPAACLPLLLEYPNVESAPQNIRQNSYTTSRLERRSDTQALNQVQPSPMFLMNLNPFPISSTIPIPSLLLHSSHTDHHQHPNEEASVVPQCKMEVQPSMPIPQPHEQLNLRFSSGDADCNHHRQSAGLNPSIFDMGNGIFGLSSSPNTAAKYAHDLSTSTIFNRAGFQMLDPYYVTAGLGGSGPLLL